VEDDMTIPLDKKVPMLNDFHTFLYQKEWRFTESQEKDRQVLADFPTVSSAAWWHEEKKCSLIYTLILLF